jgi:hypothetical protein
VAWPLITKESYLIKFLFIIGPVETVENFFRLAVIGKFEGRACGKTCGKPVENLWETFACGKLRGLYTGFPQGVWRTLWER